MQLLFDYDALRVESQPNSILQLLIILVIIIVAIKKEKHSHNFKERCNKTDWIFSCYAEIDIMANR